LCEVAERVRLVQVNLAYDRSLSNGDALLDRYHTLVEWTRALQRAGAEVFVVQRYASGARITRDGVIYQLVEDGEAPMLAPASVSSAVVTAICDVQPDVVHVNGLMFPAMVGAIRAALPESVVVLQDHSGYVPRPPIWPVRRWSRSRWSQLGDADAVSFTSRELAEPWHAVGLPSTVPVLEIVESSTTFKPVDREVARASTGVRATPAVLWVGRLNANKDPLTAIDAMERAFTRLGTAACWMIYTDATLEREVRSRVKASSVLENRVTLVGSVAHDELPAWYSAADIFLSASHREGSGYALLEAMACGAVPVVTDIPAFRAITGECGARWTVGDPNSCAEAMLRVASGDLEATRSACQKRFADVLSWEAIATRTRSAYRELVEQRRGAPRR
jgi:glycosyltransferase involved in cell wall biosynthesis